MQFSDVNKLGINPKSGYSTPLGIYSYPITKQLYRLFIAGKLPFAQGRKYIIVFKPNEDKNIVLSLGKRNDGGIDSKTFEEMLENSSVKKCPMVRLTVVYTMLIAGTRKGRASKLMKYSN